VGMVLGVGLAGAILTSVMARTPGSNALFVAVHAGLLVGAGLAILGAVIALVRGPAKT
jgi:hypothetical protein